MYNRGKKNKPYFKKYNIVFKAWKLHPFYKDIKVITPEFLISRADYEFCSNYFLRPYLKSRTGKITQLEDLYLSLAELLERSLKLNHIKKTDEKEVNRFAVKLIHDFSDTFMDMMIKDDYLFVNPRWEVGYMFFARPSRAIKIVTGNINKERAFSQSKLYLKYLHGDLKSKLPHMNKNPYITLLKTGELDVQIGKPVVIKRLAAIHEGRQFLHYSEYENLVARKFNTDKPFNMGYMPKKLTKYQQWQRTRRDLYRQKL